jgi:two-component system NtrC family response regulator
VLQRDNIVGKSREIRACLEQTARAAQTTANVLLTGETGTGKELFARAIHENSARASRPFVVVDCAALPGTLVESVLFGYVRAAFTGADRDREGLIQEADGGTLFLDEVGELPQSVQTSFLRVLQERRFRPVGAKAEVESDFRLIAATNRDLDLMVQQGNFRNDLLFRLKSLVIRLPALRDRTADIPDLTLYFLSRLSARYGMGLKGISPDFVEALLSYEWPGNVRELQNTLESALSSSKDEPTLHPFHLPTELRSKLVRASLEPEAKKQESPEIPDKRRDAFPGLREFMESVEKKYLQDLLSHTGGNIKEVCRISGISRANIYARLKKHGIARRF